MKISARIKKAGAVLLAIIVIGASTLYFYGRANPLVFNESFWRHAHCLKQAGVAMRFYASDNNGRFPVHTNGYGDALLLIPDAWLPAFTGPGNDVAVLERARQTGDDVPEDQCGRVYVQGLTTTNSHEIALMFDKLPNPGDHRHFLPRIWAKPCREVLFVDGSTRTINETYWPEFAKQQVELLVDAGIPREEALAYYTPPSQ